jgi:hypothetical protein
MQEEIAFYNYLFYIRRKNQQYALIVPLLYFYVLAPTCFGSSLLSSGSLLDPPELLENTNGGLVYHIMCGYLACVQTT